MVRTESFTQGAFDDVDQLVFDDIDELAQFREQDYEERIAAYKASQENTKNARPSQRDKEFARVLVPLLAMQCYHLPGNNWSQDLIQYVSNNHPVFGIFLHHRLHPIGAKTRIVALVGTMVFGLAMTSFFELLYIKYPSYQKILISFGDKEGGWEMTSGMLSLWTVGGGIHTAYNLFIWHIAACSCMREGGCMESAKFCHCPNFGKTFLRIFVIVIIALTVFVVCLKVVIANDNSADIEAVADLDNYQSVDDFGFVLAYFVGMALSFFFWYFLGLFVLFSGVLGCYTLPVLGGRAREVAIEEKLNEKEIANNASTNPFDDLEQPSSLSRSMKRQGSNDKNSKRKKKQNDETREYPLRKGKRKCKGKNSEDVEAPTAADSKNISSRRKKKNEGHINSSRLVFEPL